MASSSEANVWPTLDVELDLSLQTWDKAHQKSDSEAEYAVLQTARQVTKQAKLTRGTKHIRRVIDGQNTPCCKKKAS